MEPLKVVLDLDECLIYTSFWMISPSYPKDCFVTQSSLINRRIHCKRPHLHHFLNTISDKYDCYLFTNSTDGHALPVVEYLEKWVGKKLFKKVITWDHRFHSDTYTYGLKLATQKDLRNIDTNLNRTILIDDSPENVLPHQKNNYIQIKKFYGNNKDNELLYILKEIEKLENVVDVRIEDLHYLRNGPS